MTESLTRQVMTSSSGWWLAVQTSSGLVKGTCGGVLQVFEKALRLLGPTLLTATTWKVKFAHGDRKTGVCCVLPEA